MVLGETEKENLIPFPFPFSLFPTSIRSQMYELHTKSFTVRKVNNIRLCDLSLNEKVWSGSSWVKQQTQPLREHLHYAPE